MLAEKLDPLLLESRVVLGRLDEIEETTNRRLEAFLQDALAVLGDREAALANDLTKMFESVQRGTISTLLEWVKQSNLKGEFIVVIAGAGAAPLLLQSQQ